MTYAFSFDASSCSGCKACQLACKDKNNLPLGVLWRRVYEISGGTWQPQGEAWTNSVFAYNLSLACNHCVHPKCAGVCPTNAYIVRPDGIVHIQPSRCIGCGYCAWACPYDAPQVDRSAGIMTKCDLCYDNLDRGVPPACVSACPLRCLELVEVQGQLPEHPGIELWSVPGSEHPFPLPAFSRTEPRLVIQPHASTGTGGEAGLVSNREEIDPSISRKPGWDELPLLFFTLLAQMAIGAFGTIFMIICSLNDKQAAWKITFNSLLAVGAAITLALLVSFLHLGRPKNAWRVLDHLRKSWLSREILFLLIFTGSWAVVTGLSRLRIGSSAVWVFLAGLTTLFGLASLESMHNVYRLRTVPGWNNWRTRLEFASSAAGLGSLLTGALLPRETPGSVLAWIYGIAVLVFLTGLFIAWQSRGSTVRKWQTIRVVLLFLGLLGAVSLFFFPTSSGIGALFLIALLEETLERWLFYARRKPSL